MSYFHDALNHCAVGKLNFQSFITKNGQSFIEKTETYFLLVFVQKKKMQAKHEIFVIVCNFSQCVKNTQFNT